MQESILQQFTRRDLKPVLYYVFFKTPINDFIA